MRVFFSLVVLLISCAAVAVEKPPRKAIAQAIEKSVNSAKNPQEFIEKTVGFLSEGNINYLRANLTRGTELPAIVAKGGSLTLRVETYKIVIEPVNPALGQFLVNGGAYTYRPTDSAARQMHDVRMFIKQPKSVFRWIIPQAEAQVFYGGLIVSSVAAVSVMSLYTAKALMCETFKCEPEKIPTWTNEQFKQAFLDHEITQIAPARMPASVLPRAVDSK